MWDKIVEEFVFDSLLEVRWFFTLMSRKRIVYDDILFSNKHFHLNQFETVESDDFFLQSCNLLPTLSLYSIESAGERERGGEHNV